MSLPLVMVVGCSEPPDPRRTNFEIAGKEGIARYDPKTGRLTRIDADLNTNGRVETFGYWDATRVIRIEIDQDEDGKIDRWEHYDEQNVLVSIGSSSRDDGTEDMWTYPDASGFLARVDSDGDRDGRIDKREMYMSRPDAAESRVLASVELEFDDAGNPRRRIHYNADGTFGRVELLARQPGRE